MTPTRAAQLVAEACLASGQPLGPALRNPALSRGAANGAALAEAGKVGPALVALGFNSELVAVGTEWPAALRPASQALAQLPMRGQLAAPLWGAAAYFVLIAFLLVVVSAVLSLKVSPVLAKFTADAAGVKASLDFGAWLYLALAVPLLALALAWIARYRGFPRVGRALERARGACMVFALLETNGPEELVHKAAARVGLAPGVEPSNGQDWAAVAQAAAARARAAMAVRVAAVRVGGLVVLTLLALRLLLRVYGTIMLLWQVRA